MNSVGQDHLRVFRGLPQDPKGAQAWFYSKLSGHTYSSSSCMSRLRADDRWYTVDP